MKNRLLAASALAGTLLFVSVRAEAQSAPEPQPSLPQDAPLVGTEAVEEGDTVIVTGSRIRRAEYDALEPTTVVSSEYLDVRGITNVADALNEQPGFGIPQSAEGGQSSYGVSQNFVNKFGLGTARTLTIVNGRRFVSTNAPTVLGNPAGLQVDLNVIPSLMVERVENVAIGGAPVYGSDAIAGTVNIILKKNYEGVELQALSGISDKGDNYRLNLSGIAGFKIGAEGLGHVLIGGSYDRNDGLRAVDRKRAREALTFQTNPSVRNAATQFPGRTTGNDGRINPNVPFNGNLPVLDGIPNTVLIGNTRIFSESTAGLILPFGSTNGILNGNVPGFGASGANRLQFDGSGNIVPYDQGSPFGNTYGSGGDGFNLTDTRPLTNDLERYSVNLVADYEFAPWFKVFYEGTYYHGVGREIIDQPVYNSPLFPGGANSALTFNVNDPRLNAQARTILQGYGVTNFYLSRDFVDITNGAASSETNVYRGVLGVGGDFQALGGKTFTYEASVNIGRTTGAFHQVLLDQQKFVNAINNCNPNPLVNAAPGGVTPIADAACVALDPFGPGRLDPGAVAYVNYRSTARSVIEQQVYNFNIGSSDLVTLWSGGVGFNLGYEHRHEFGKFTPDPFQVAGRGRAAAIVGNQGGFNTDEVFGELLVPLVSRDNNVPLIDSLTLEGRGRYVNNSINGGFWAYTGGGRYRPIPDIEFRGNYTRSLRAPSIVELFTPRTNAGSFFPDPCDAANIGGGSNPAIRQRNCQAFFQAYGITNEFGSIARTSAVPGVTGGNPNLKNEVADSYTFGVVLRPRFLPRFQAAIDWNRIKVTGNIASLTAANIAEGCYDNPSFDLNNPDAGNSFCTQFTRVHSADANENGQIASNPAAPGIRTGFVNGSFMEFKGLTATASYLIPLDGIGVGGRISLDGSFFYLDTLRSSNNGVTIDPQAGEIGTPKYSGQMNVSYASPSGAGISIQANYTGKAKYDMLFNADSRDILELDDQWLFNLALSQKIADKATLRFNVSNLFDTAPPYPYDLLSSYDLLGRRYTVSMNVKF
ncbi:TonB-dependent receptor [Sphingomonas sp. ZT3P38]|uniref:TonB-dependent receptor domain-containing protein n=1 Tax=Parasphingomonas zepuensis TaxID=3096161 RepID=UPI002FC83440